MRRCFCLNILDTVKLEIVTPEMVTRTQDGATTVTPSHRFDTDDGCVSEWIWLTGPLNCSTFLATSYTKGIIFFKCNWYIGSDTVFTLSMHRVISLVENEGNDSSDSRGWIHLWSSSRVSVCSRQVDLVAVFFLMGFGDTSLTNSWSHCCFPVSLHRRPAEKNAKAHSHIANC